MPAAGVRGRPGLEGDRMPDHPGRPQGHRPRRPRRDRDHPGPLLCPRPAGVRPPERRREDQDRAARARYAHRRRRDLHGHEQERGPPDGDGRVFRPDPLHQPERPENIEGPPPIRPSIHAIDRRARMAISNTFFHSFAASRHPCARSFYSFSADWPGKADPGS